MNIFTDYPNVTYVKFERCKIEIFKFPTGIKKPSKMQNILLHNNLIRKIDPLTMAQFPFIENLSFRQCKLMKIPKNAFVINVKIDSLGLEKNVIEVIEDGACQTLVVMTNLNLSFNKITNYRKIYLQT